MRKLDPFVTQVVTAHLLVEEELHELLRTAAPRAEALVFLKSDFARRVQLARAFSFWKEKWVQQSWELLMADTDLKRGRNHRSSFHRDGEFPNYLRRIFPRYLRPGGIDQLPLYG